MQHAQPGDTIEVYSGIYQDTNITINQEGLSLIGIPYELSTGNNTGKPIVNITQTTSLIEIFVTADHVTITDFILISFHPSGWSANILAISILL